MTSFESNNSNAVEANGIRLEIREPNLIVLPIPENRFGSNTFVQIVVDLINNTSTPFRLNPNNSLMPELLTSDGQLLQGQVVPAEPVGIQMNTAHSPSLRAKLTRLRSNLTRLLGRSETKEFDEYLVEPGHGKNSSLIAKLCWRDNKLKLQIIKGRYSSITFKLGNSWSFDALQPGTYQLRFTYSSLSGNEPSSDAETREKMSVGQLATQFVNLCLIEPVGSDKSAVEVDGICFETIMPERILNVPPTQPNVSTFVQIGIRITNNTPTPVRFSLFATLIPQLVGADGQTLQRDYFCRVEGKPLDSHFPLVMPGESLTFFQNTTVSRHKKNTFTLNITDSNGCTWFFGALKLDTYQIQLTYNNKNATKEIYEQERTNTRLIQGLWTGIVSTPYVEFRLVQP